ncbi:MAG: NADH-quinone oxidoreductase subunit NuoF [Deferribacteres bacterium]|nr:NADH-quinone oxidoreductase subunit NuoF [candidate division KSB1 bacterium]MCB9511061.1 NADH-quinone oxidoreductase subunit NuoF [Deferribacteres bacterium]
MSKNGKILTPLIENDCNLLENYKKFKGYEAAKKALKMSQDEVIEEVQKSNLRGLGGAGFPTGRKWAFIPKNSQKPVYLVINCDESEPGTFKDKYIVSSATHVLIEGIIIASYAIGAHTCYIYIRGEYVEPARRIEAAIKEAYDAGILGKKVLGTDFNLDVYVHRGAGAYICGEETALLNSLEGKKGWPRMKPPFPAIEGLFRCPTIVNNVETIAYVPPIIQNGPKWFADMGTERSGGMRFYGISGNVNKPGIYELPVGTPLREMIYEHAGGIPGGKALKCVVPGGVSAPPLRPDEIDVPMDPDALAKIGTMIGSAGIIVMDEDTNLVEMLMASIRFYHHESCAQCTPCREGTGWLDKILQRMLSGGARERDIDDLYEIGDSIFGNTICPLGDSAGMVAKGYIDKFRGEFEAYLSKSIAAKSANSPELKKAS